MSHSCHQDLEQTGSLDMQRWNATCGNDDVISVNASSCGDVPCPCHSDVTLPPSLRLALCVWLGLILAVSVPGNGMVCCLVMRRAAMRSATNLLVLAMATADVITTLIGVPTSIATLVADQMTSHLPDNGVVALFQVTFAAASVLLLLVTSVDRYLVLVYDKGRLTPGAALGLAAACCLAAALLTLTLLLDLHIQPLTFTMTLDHLSQADWNRLLTFSCLVCYLPVLLMAFCFTCLVSIRQRARRQVDCVNYDVTVRSSGRRSSCSLRQCSPCVAPPTPRPPRIPGTRSASLTMSHVMNSATSCSQRQDPPEPVPLYPDYQQTPASEAGERSEVYVVSRHTGRQRCSCAKTSAPLLGHCSFRDKTSLGGNPCRHSSGSQVVRDRFLSVVSACDFMDRITLPLETPSLTSSSTTLVSMCDTGRYEPTTHRSPNSEDSTEQKNAFDVSEHPCSNPVRSSPPTKIDHKSEVLGETAKTSPKDSNGKSKVTSAPRSRHCLPSPQRVRRHRPGLQPRIRKFTTACVLFLVALVCWTPYWTALLAAAMTGRERETYTHVAVLQCLLQSRAALNPLVYAARVPQYRQAWRRLSPWRLRCPRCAGCLSSGRLDPAALYRIGPQV